MLLSSFAHNTFSNCLVSLRLSQKTTFGCEVILAGVGEMVCLTFIGLGHYGELTFQRIKNNFIQRKLSL